MYVGGLKGIYMHIPMRIHVFTICNNINYCGIVSHNTSYVVCTRARAYNLYVIEYKYNNNYDTVIDNHLIVTELTKNQVRFSLHSWMFDRILSLVSQCG